MVPGRAGFDIWRAVAQPEAKLQPARCENLLNPGPRSAPGETSGGQLHTQRPPGRGPQKGDCKTELELGSRQELVLPKNRTSIGEEGSRQKWVFSKNRTSMEEEGLRLDLRVADCASGAPTAYYGGSPTGSPALRLPPTGSDTPDPAY